MSAVFSPDMLAVIPTYVIFITYLPMYGVGRYEYSVCTEYVASKFILCSRPTLPTYRQEAPINCSVMVHWGTTYSVPDRRDSIAKSTELRRQQNGRAVASLESDIRMTKRHGYAAKRGGEAENCMLRTEYGRKSRKSIPCELQGKKKERRK